MNTPLTPPPAPPLAPASAAVENTSVVALTWKLCDSLGELLDEMLDPVEFLVGMGDLLPAMDSALIGKNSGDIINLNLEPEVAFGDYHEEWVEWVERKDCGADIVEGDALALLPVSKKAAPEGHVWIVTELYPEHAVLDANHPLAGIGLRVEMKIHAVRAAQGSEIAAGSAGTGFFRMRDFLA